MNKISVKQIIDRDFEVLSQQMYDNAELGVDHDDEGHSSECIENFDQLISSAAEQVGVAYLEENGIDMDDDKFVALLDRASAMIEKRVDADEMLSEIQDANQAYHDQWSDYYAMTCGGIR